MSKTRKFIKRSNLIELLLAMKSDYISDETVMTMINWYFDEYEIESKNGEKVFNRTTKSDGIRRLLGEKFEDLSDFLR